MNLNNLGSKLHALERHGDGVQAIEEAVQILSPFFLRLPLAFGAWMATMVGNYLKSVEAADQTPNEALLNPIQEVLNSLDQEQPSKA